MAPYTQISAMEARKRDLNGAIVHVVAGTDPFPALPGHGCSPRATLAVWMSFHQTGSWNERAEMSQPESLVPGGLPIRYRRKLDQRRGNPFLCRTSADVPSPLRAGPPCRKYLDPRGHWGPGLLHRKFGVQSFQFCFFCLVSLSYLIQALWSLLQYYRLY